MARAIDILMVSRVGTAESTVAVILISDFVGGVAGSQYPVSRVVATSL